jgi:hypothetical protein
VGTVYTLPYPTPLWAAAQLIPSPGVYVSERGAHFHLRWQFTPLLYSFGTRRELNRFRTFVVEPLVRQGGSVELFVSPEFFDQAGRFEDHWGLRFGARAYFPVLQHGDNLSVSLAVSDLFYRGQHSAGFELGAYVLFGVLGLQLTYTPRIEGGQGMWLTFRVRYF